MANQLTMALIDSILSLHQRHWSNRRIARELGIDRQTVADHLRAHAGKAKPATAPIGAPDSGSEAKPATAPIGAPDTSSEAKSATAPIGSPGAEPGPGLDGSERQSQHGPGRASDCAAWHDIILGKLDLGLSAQRVYQDLTTEHGYSGSYYSVRRFVHRLEQQTPLPFRRLECRPGQEVQVDFGTGAMIEVDGKRRRSYVFRMVLSHSRKGYSEAVWRQTTEDFIRCLENAFWAFGGTPEQVILDNLKAAVAKADWFDPDINPKVRSFANHYGVALLPTRPYTPRHKGKVERGVDYVQENALKGRRFASLNEQNTFLRTWEETVADTRVHGTIRRQVGQLFLASERPALAALPAERFPFFHEEQRSVHRDGHIEVAKAYYSVPPEYLGRRVWVRWDARLLRVFNNRLEEIAVHALQEPGRFSTQRQHIAAAKIAGVERGTVWLLERVRLLGAGAAQWAEAMVENRGIEGVRVLQGLLALASRHPASSIDRACAQAASCGAYRLRTVRALLSQNAPQQEALPFVEEHALIRPLADYEELVHTSFQKER